MSLYDGFVIILYLPVVTSSLFFSFASVCGYVVTSLPFFVDVIPFQTAFFPLNKIFSVLVIHILLYLRAHSIFTLEHDQDLREFLQTQHK